MSFPRLPVRRRLRDCKQCCLVCAGVPSHASAVGCARQDDPDDEDPGPTSRSRSPSSVPSSLFTLVSVSQLQASLRQYEQKVEVLENELRKVVWMQPRGLASRSAPPSSVFPPFIPPPLPLPLPYPLPLPLPYPLRLPHSLSLFHFSLSLSLSFSTTHSLTVPTSPSPALPATMWEMPPPLHCPATG